MSFDRLLRLLAMLLAFGLFAGGAVAAQPTIDDGAPAVVFAEDEGDDGDGEGDEGEGEDEGQLAPMSDDGADEDTEDDTEDDTEEGDGK